MSDAGTNEKVNDMGQENTLNQQERSKIKILLLIKELATIQLTNATLSTKIFIREGKEQISMATEQKKKDIVEKAKIYGKKAETMARTYISNMERGITQTKGKVIQQVRVGRDKAEALAEPYMVIHQYKENLKAIQKEYEGRFEWLVSNTTRMEDLEEISFMKEEMLRERRNQIKETPEYQEYQKQKGILLHEAEQACEKKDIDTSKAKRKQIEALEQKSPLLEYDKRIEAEREKRKEIREVIEEATRVLKICELDRDNNIKKATEQKDNKLANIEQHGIFKETLGFLFAKAKGARRIVGDIIEKAQETNYHISDELLPSIRERMSEGIDQAIDAINEKGRSLAERGKPVVERGVDKTKQIGRQVLHKTRESGIKIWEGTRETRAKAWKRTKETGRKAWDKTKETGTNVLNKTKETGIQFAQEAKEDWEYIKEVKEQMMQKLESSLIETIERGKQLNTMSSVYYAEIKQPKPVKSSMAYDECVYDEMLGYEGR